ncbi:MAG: 4-hydroxy-tetrahydrodipicolinate reductase [Desulfovibrionaceae bacterium]|nr:4-hydroxy-tetrahydrodipicolinate reductase [Desulfovibrionaceae bacterium]
MKTGIVVMGACGRMGKTICDLVNADERYTLAGMVERPEALAKLAGAACPVGDSLHSVLPQAPGAVIIDFTAPEASLANAQAAAQYGSPLVIGTTGFSDEQKAQLAGYAAQTPLFWASNMSIGVNVLLKILPELARVLGEQYDIDIMEIHHNKKKDAPSGTALTIAECLAKARGWELNDVRNSARDGIIGARPHKEIGVQALRGGDVVGVHTVYFMGAGERIEVTHQAHSRENFAQGALRAALWLKEQPAGKLYSMNDIFA